MVQVGQLRVFAHAAEQAASNRDMRLSISAGRVPGAEIPLSLFTPLSLRRLNKSRLPSQKSLLLPRPARSRHFSHMTAWVTVVPVGMPNRCAL